MCATFKQSNQFCIVRLYINVFFLRCWIYVMIRGTDLFEMKPSPLTNILRRSFSVPFDKETVKYALYDDRRIPLYTGCQSSSERVPDYSGLRGDIHSSWFTRSTRRAEEWPAAEDAPRSSIEMLHNRNMRVCAREGKPKVLLCTYCTRNMPVDRNILACVDCSNSLYSRSWSSIANDR